MPNLSNKWSKQPQPSIAEKINDTLKPKGPLKPRVQNGIKNYNYKLKIRFNANKLTRT